MSKSIYEEAKEILLNIGTEFIYVPCNPIGEENSDMIHLRDVTETYETNMHEVVKALEQAQKQEKLLELYKLIVHLWEHRNEYTNSVYEREKIWKMVRELEKEIEELK